MQRFLVLSFLIGTAGVLQAQNCAQTLRLARSTYDQGRLHELPALIAGCLKDNSAAGFSKQERVEAYKLLTMGYIYLEEPKKADSCMLLLLQTDSYFKPNKDVDPQEFLGLYNTFRTWPIYRLGLKAGAVGSQPNVVNSNVTNMGNTAYKNAIGVTFGAFAEIPFLKKIVINPELYYSSRKFELDNSIAVVQTPMTESQSWVSAPISLQYEYNKIKFEDDKAKILPYAALGVQFDYLLSASVDITTERVGYSPVAPKTVDVKSLRNPLNISAVASLGGKMKLGPGLLIAEARFVYGITPVTQSSSIFENQNLVFSNYIADSIYKINSISVTVGYGYNFFHPRKLTKKMRTSIKKTR